MYGISIVCWSIFNEIRFMAEFHGIDWSFFDQGITPRRGGWGALSRITISSDCGSLSRFLTFYQGREQQGQYQRSAGIFFSPSVKFMPMTIGWTGIVSLLLQIGPHVVQPFFRLWTEPILSINTNGSPWTFLFRKASVRFIGLDSAYLTSLRKNREVATASLAWISSSISV